MRIAPVPLAVLLTVLTLTVLSSACHAGTFRIAAWNLEHLNDTDMEGCVPRKQADYDAIRHRIAALDADIFAFQEVENNTAARRIFPTVHWQIEMSASPSMGPGYQCSDRPSARLSRLATGFAVRRGIPYRRNSDLTGLATGDPFGRWGTDLSVTEGGHELRLLSVHLMSGCWGTEQDRDRGREESCAVLRRQIALLKTWADARRAEGTAFVILGDFNRRLAVPGDWAWGVLSPPSATLHLATSDIATTCDTRFKHFIDHLVLDDKAATMLVSGSIYEMPRHGLHPDHCAVSADFILDSCPGVERFD